MTHDIRRLVAALATTLVMALCIVSCTDTDDKTPEAYASLEQVLVGNELFTEMKENPDTTVMKKRETGELTYLSQYSMFILQPVNHDQPGGDKFKQKVCILFRGYDRPTIMVTEGYLWNGFGDAEDIGKNLNANMVHVEHRNFGESFNQDKGKWEYETSAQASADLHAVYQALKPIFKGKWMSAGTSKNGETSIDYAYYYPNDMDLAAAFCSPFIVSLSDKRFGKYLFNEVSTEDLRDKMKQNIRKALENGKDGLYKKACKHYEEKQLTVPSFAEYVFNCFDTFFQFFQYTSPSRHQEFIKNIIENEEKLVSAICTTIGENRDTDAYTYFVDCAKEQGAPDPGYDYFADLLEDTGFKAVDGVTALLKEEDRWLVKHYDNSQRTKMCEYFFVNSTKPLLLYYSKDDPWTAGQPEKTGPNVKKVINPIGVHSSHINDPAYCPTDVKQEVMDFISSYIH